MTEEKTLAEDDFTGKISLLTEEIQHQVADLNRIKGELKEETNSGRVSKIPWTHFRRKRTSQNPLSSHQLTVLLSSSVIYRPNMTRLSQCLNLNRHRTESLRKTLMRLLLKKKKHPRALTTEKEELKSALEMNATVHCQSEQELQKIIGGKNPGRAGTDPEHRSSGLRR